ncbi:caspase family protein [Bradyrhizobium sp. 197]|uniref:caspase family protein n=1 Tax=Bradyrhizobium sp. 197 TaxID=2782663 RepID=UPI001FF7183A|nr:caspase family protein [Bradyrhizobium sp. 197]MCK1478050.1 caspase family protein [Bradyrhizobium sp. 197]
MRTFVSVLTGMLLCCIGTQAVAEARVALVIGNSKYQYVPNLSNPANDAAAINLLLKSAGFDVVETRENLGVNDMRRAIRDFSDRTRDAEIAVIYYAGHGMEVSGINYLVPIDATLRRDIDVEDETVSLDRLLQVMEPAKRLRLIILDACRDNPFAKSMTRTMARRTIGRGLAPVEPTTSDTLIAFAAKAGLTAADGDETHSPFTSALLKHLVTPGLDVRLAFGRVRDDVMKATSNKQEPFVYGSLGGSAVTLASLSTDERIELPGTNVDTIAARDYEAAAKVGTRESWELFLEKHSSGFYSDLARRQIAKIDNASLLPKGKKPIADAEPSKPKPTVRTARSSPKCRPDYEASYQQSLAVARSAGEHPAAMIAQHKRQCGN